MYRLIVFFTAILIMIPVCSSTWVFYEANYSPGESITDSGIAWRPQGDYAIIATRTGLMRFDHPSGLVSYQGFSGVTLYRLAWARDGSYALITGLGHVYRYDHAEAGFGSLTEITSIESGSDTITFYDVVINPAINEPPYIVANREISSSSHQIVVFRYDPEGTPYQVYKDYSGGTTYAAQWEYGPVSASFQADGDYFVIANKLANGYDGGFFVFDPDQSTFPPETGNAMQFYAWSFYIGNCNAVAMSRAPGTQFVTIKGNGKVQRASQIGLPASFIRDTALPYGPDTSTYSGDADYCWDGSRGIVVDSQENSPHKIIIMNSDGSFRGSQDLSVSRSIGLYAVKWHPSAPMGLMGGADRWLVAFATDEVPYPVPTETPTVPPTQTPTGQTATPTFTPTATSTWSPTPTPSPTMPTVTPTEPPATGTPTSTFTPPPTLTPPPTSTFLPTNTPAPTRTTVPTNTPPVTHTPTPTTTPTEEIPPTNTAAPTWSPVPSSTPSPPATASPMPTWTPLPTGTAEPTAMPDTLTLELHLSEETFTGGDRFCLQRKAINPGPEITVQEWLILEAGGMFWFAPSWTETPSYDLLTLPGESIRERVIFDFDWPDDVSGSAHGLRFWGAFLDPVYPAIVGEFDMVDFGYE